MGRRGVCSPRAAKASSCLPREVSGGGGAARWCNIADDDPEEDREDDHLGEFGDSTDGLEMANQEVHGNFEDVSQVCDFVGRDHTMPRIEAEAPTSYESGCENLPVAKSMHSNLLLLKAMTSFKLMAVPRSRVKAVGSEPCPARAYAGGGGAA